ncbi:MAG: substrate-binding periplasmic protein [Arcobacter sp.]|uniref:substrate-binding periplasmic protein n=1 Tax=Arcobacter sp. TaxID=1872629 RepID=UPI003B001B1D
MSKSMQSQKNKNIFQNIITLFAFMLIITIDCLAVDEIDIKYGYPDQSIFIATVNGKEQPTTPMLFVANELFKKANLTWRATAYPAKRLFNNLKSGETNFSILVRASSLLESCIFSKEPVYTTNLNVYSLGNKPVIATKEDLVGNRVAIIRGYSYGKLRKFIQDPKNNIKNEVTNTHSSAFRMLELGRVDYVVDYASAAKDIIAENSISDVRVDTLSPLNIYLVISKSYSNADELMKKLETIAESINVKEIIKRSGVKSDIN